MCCSDALGTVGSWTSESSMCCSGALDTIGYLDTNGTWTSDSSICCSGTSDTMDASKPIGSGKNCSGASETSDCRERCVQKHGTIGMDRKQAATKDPGGG